MSRPRCTISRLVVCDPRKAALLKEGNKSDRIDARKLAELLRTNQVRPVYHGEHGIRTLKELGRSYLTVSKEITRTMNRIKLLLDANPFFLTSFFIELIDPEPEDFECNR